MHRFLRAIGFSKQYSKQEIDQLLGYVMNEPDYRTIIKSGKAKYVEIRRQTGKKTGIVICGEYDQVGFFHVKHYFPYVFSDVFTALEDVVVNKRVDTDAYTGMCDDVRIGISLIFYLQNAADYLRLGCEDNTPHRAKISFSGLSLGGKIILGVYRSNTSQIQKMCEGHEKQELIKQAKEGDQDAIDSLTLDEMDLSSQIRRRIKTEDLYSIVETTFVPYGSESDNYMVIGTIINWTSVSNQYTGEQIVLLQINCNDLLITISIHRDDLLGEPILSARFKGIVWMQGNADYDSLDEL